MAQEHLIFGAYEAPDPDEDGYQIDYATTSTSSSGRTQRGRMINTAMFTVEAYTLKWTDISASEAKSILLQVMGKNSFNFYHYNLYKGKWEWGEFYAANISTPLDRLNEGQERVDELSFQVTGIDPV